jgi:hypothetical protein
MRSSSRAPLASFRRPMIQQEPLRLVSQEGDALFKLRLTESRREEILR